MICEDKYFNLDNLNTRILNIELGYMETKDRPTPVTAVPLNSTRVTLKQSGRCKYNSCICTCTCTLLGSCFFLLVAAQMWLLARILPIIVGDYVPNDDDRWENFLLLMDIVDRLFCPKITEDDAMYVKWLISDHHKEFVRLYPDSSVIPKMHFMIHTPHLMLQ